MLLTPDRSCIRVIHGLPRGATNPSSTLLRTACGTSITRLSAAPHPISHRGVDLFHQTHSRQIPASGTTVGLVRQASVQKNTHVRTAPRPPSRRYLAVIQSAIP